MRTRFEIDPSQFPELWQSALKLIQQEVVAEQVRAWIMPLDFLGTRQEGELLHVQFAAPNDWVRNWVLNNGHKKTIEAAFQQLTAFPCSLQIEVRTQQDRDDGNALQGGESRPMAPASEQSERPRGGQAHDDRIDPQQTFSTYIVGNSNRFAQASAVAVAEKPAQGYNPLFLYSPPGLGKTHLLHAIANHFKGLNPNARVAYLSAEQFVNELVESLKKGQMIQFRNKYRNSFDMILIDDIQFIAGKGSSEEEFFHTFNALHSSRRQIVVTSDRPPKEIESLEERVKTRFLHGLVADIQPPEIETRIAILKGKAERDDVYLPDDVATFLATHVKSNVRELEGVLVKLTAQSSLTGAEISLEMAKQELNFTESESDNTFTVESIQAAVVKHFNIKVQDLKSTSRAGVVTRPRHIAIYLTRKYTGLGLKEIGAHFGGRDHTSILHACKVIEKGIDADAAIREAVESIQDLL
jgi:chromosomal replication initiator protein